MIKIFILVFLFLFSSCGSPRFAKDGIFVEDVDQYFNPKQDINVWVYANFYPYKGLGRGVRMGSLYSQDREVLKEIGFRSRKTKVFFSALPESEPFYHLIAIQHLQNNFDFHGFDRIEVDSSYYFQKDFRLDRLDIRQVYIPYDDNQKGLSLVYCISSEKHYICPFCKLEYLAHVNAQELQHNKGHDFSWQIFDCGQFHTPSTTIALNETLIKKYTRSYLKIFADYESSKGIQYFKVLNPNSKAIIELKLCPEQYIIELLDDTQRVLQTDTIVVK